MITWVTRLHQWPMDQLRADSVEVPQDHVPPPSPPLASLVPTHRSL